MVGEEECYLITKQLNWINSLNAQLYKTALTIVQREEGDASLAGCNDLHELLQFVRVLQSHHSGHLLAVLHPDQHWNGAHVEVEGQVIVFIDIDLRG